MHSITGFLENELRLSVNQEKSAVAHVQERKFLGYQLLSEGRLGIAPEAWNGLKPESDRSPAETGA